MFGASGLKKVLIANISAKEYPRAPLYISLTIPRMCVNLCTSVGSKVSAQEHVATHWYNRCYLHSAMNPWHYRHNREMSHHILTMRVSRWLGLPVQDFLDVAPHNPQRRSVLAFPALEYGCAVDLSRHHEIQNLAPNLSRCRHLRNR